MLFLGEGHHDDKVNGGFYAVRNSQRVRDIMRKAKAATVDLNINQT